MVEGDTNQMREVKLGLPANANDDAIIARLVLLELKAYRKKPYWFKNIQNFHPRCKKDTIKAIVDDNDEVVSWVYKLSP